MNTNKRVSIKSLSIAFPSVLWTNDYFRRRYPEMVARAEQQALAKVFGTKTEVESRKELTAFERAMAPYLDDPFRGAVARRVLAHGETILSVELAAARGALDAAKLTAADIDLVLTQSFPGDRLVIGNAGYLAAALDMKSPVFNFESACSGSLVGLQLAFSLVQGGVYRRVLVVASTSNSAITIDDDALSWFVGDGAGAYVVEESSDGSGVLGWHTINSIESNDMFIVSPVLEHPLSRDIRLVCKPTPKTASIVASTAEPYLRKCTSEALIKAGLCTTDIDFWVFNTPAAWYADFCAAILGVEAGRYHSIYPKYANCGAALNPAALYHAIYEKKIGAGATVLLYSIGSSSTASAVVLRLGDVALGPYPPAPLHTDAEGIASKRFGKNTVRM
jgi:3-oxoacyl-[acyl-carrier-protein] synthase III